MISERNKARWLPAPIVTVQAPTPQREGRAEFVQKTTALMMAAWLASSNARVIHLDPKACMHKAMQAADLLGLE